jgi:hypothetical protein
MAFRHRTAYLIGNTGTYALPDLSGVSATVHRCAMTVLPFSSKAELPSAYTPALFLDALRKSGWQPGVVPETVIYTYARFELYLATRPDVFSPNQMLGTGPGRFFIVNESDGRVGINCLGTGPSATAAQIELQADLGVRRALIVGTAGGLLSDQSPGDIVLPTSAVRADGTTDHYAPVDTPALPNGELVQSVRRVPGTTRLGGHSRTVLDDRSAVPHYCRRDRLLRRSRRASGGGGSRCAVHRRRRPRASDRSRSRPRRGTD